MRSIHISATIRAAPDNETESDDAPAGIFSEHIKVLRVELLYNGNSTTFFSVWINFEAYVMDAFLIIDGDPNSIKFNTIFLSFHTAPST